jgi:hypothetical protein
MCLQLVSQRTLGGPIIQVKRADYRVLLRHIHEPGKTKKYCSLATVWLNCRSPGYTFLFRGSETHGLFCEDFWAKASWVILNFQCASFLRSWQEIFYSICPICSFIYSICAIVEQPISASCKENGIDHSWNKISLQCNKKVFSKKYLLSLKLTNGHTASMMQGIKLEPTGCSWIISLPPSMVGVRGRDVKRTQVQRRHLRRP